MIIVTGAAGFIGSYMLAYLQKQTDETLIAVDDFSRLDKNAHLEGLRLGQLIDRRHALSYIDAHAVDISGIYHLGARTDTVLLDQPVFDRLNIDYSKGMWDLCVAHQIPLVYASSAATYGDGSLGFSDDHEGIDALRPMNPYAVSKQVVDQYILAAEHTPPWWAGFKFFNVYGPHEDHKGRMASVIWHAYHQIRDTRGMKLFRSHRADVLDGHQSRDFIYVHDLVAGLHWFMQHRPQPAIYNLGTGQARTFLDLVRAVFAAMDIDENISFIDTPISIRDSYQYFTEADMSKWHSTGCPVVFHTLEDGARAYVQEYLMKKYPL